MIPSVEAIHFNHESHLLRQRYRALERRIHILCSGSGEVERTGARCIAQQVDSRDASRRDYGRSLEAIRVEVLYSCTPHTLAEVAGGTPVYPTTEATVDTSIPREGGIEVRHALSLTWGVAATIDHESGGTGCVGINA